MILDICVTGEHTEKFVLLTKGSTNITPPTNPFRSSDIGKTVVGPGIPPDAVIVGIAHSGVAVMNKPAGQSWQGCHIYLAENTPRIVYYQMCYTTQPTGRSGAFVVHVLPQYWGETPLFPVDSPRTRALRGDRASTRVASS